MSGNVGLRGWNMTETNGKPEQKRQNRTWKTMLFIITLATILVWFHRIDGVGWGTIVLAVFAGWQGRGYAEKALKGGE